MEKDNMNRGRSAERPKEIPSRGWKEVLTRVKDEFSNDHLDIISAGIGFYFFLALFPFIAAVIAIYGLAFDPAQVQQHMDQLANVLPEQAHTMVSQGMQSVAQGSDQALGLALMFSILVSLWSANQATKAIFEGVNIAYNEKNERGFFKNNAITLAVTLGVIVVGIICAALVVAFPALVGNLGLPDVAATIISLARWPLLFIIVAFSIAVVYKIAPDRDNPQFRWVSWGAVVATILWIAGSLLFSLYVNNFGNFDATYGSAAAVIILMLWFQLTGLSILLGAEVNSEMEHQTSKDTTVGEPQPLGKREAYYADHVPGKKEESSKPQDEKPERKEGEKKTQDEKNRERERIRRRIRAKKNRKPNDQNFRDKGDKG